MDQTETRTYYQHSSQARLLMLLVVALGSCLVPLALAASVVAIPAIADELQANAILVSGIPTIYVLAQAVLLIPAGRLADRYGRKFIFLAGNILFAVFTVLSGLAQSIEALLFYRAVQGIASAMIFSTGLAIISSVFRHHNSAFALGIVISVIYVGMTAGPLLGGWFTEHYGWRSVFFFQVPLAVLTIALTLLAKGEWLNKEAVTIDWIGTLLFSLWSCGLFLGIALLPHASAWLVLLGSLACFVLFIYQQQTTKTPLIRFKLVRENRAFSSTILAAIFMYGGNYTLVFLLSLYLQYNQGLSPTDSGKIIMFQALSMALMAPIVGQLSTRFSARYMAAIGCTIVSLSFLSLITLQDNSSHTFIISALLIMGFGFGLFSTPNSNTALTSVSESQLAMGSALLNLARLIGNMLGMIVATVLLAIFIGKQAIVPEYYDDLLVVLQLAMGIAALSALGSAWFSFSRNDNQSTR